MQVDVAIVGAGAGGLAAVASLLKQNPKLTVTVFDPADEHYYQPGWTLVGSGLMPQEKTVRSMDSVIPEKVSWVQEAVTEFHPDSDFIRLTNGVDVTYKVLIVAPGLKVDCDAIPGLQDTLGYNGVSCNYRHDLAPYSWKCIQNLKSGKAIFTQPPMPIKCAGALQKAVYLAADYWRQQGCLSEIEFRNAGAVLFGVAEFVPVLNSYIEKYGAQLKFNSNLIHVDGTNQIATFQVTDSKGKITEVEGHFAYLHAVPPQTSPDFIKNSPLSNAAGWLDVNQDTLQHNTYANIFGLGDVISAPNTKTAAAVRKQAPVVARNIHQLLNHATPDYQYDGCGSYPLTVERGKVVMAEFGYGGKLLPTIKGLDPTIPRSIWWAVKAKYLIPMYFDLMLKGREILAIPERAKTPNT